MPDSKVKRRLLAMLAADVVGYSRLMGDDEMVTLSRQKSLYGEVVHPGIPALIGQHQGVKAVKLNRSRLLPATTSGGIYVYDHQYA